MEKYCTMTYLSKKITSGEYNIIKAIDKGKCYRCGFNECINNCPNCIELGELKKDDNLFKLKKEIKNPQYIQGNKNILMTELQKACSDKMINQYKRNKDLLVWAVCGAGKTEITFGVIEEALKNKENICFAIPRIDILYDVAERLKDYFPHTKVVVLNSKEEKYKDGQIYVVTTNQVLNFSNCFSICIVDEVDAFPYEHNPKFDYAIKKSLLKNGGSIFYLTSTPSVNLFNKKIEQFIINRRWHGFDLPVPSIEPLNLDSLKLNLKPRKLKRVLKNYQRQQLWFVENIKQGEKLYQIFKNSTKKFGFVHANDLNRRDKVISFKKGQTNILITTTILERGVTFDDVDVYVISAGSMMYNKAALIQIAGRVNRKKDYQLGKVVFFHQGISKTMESAILEIKNMNKT